MFMRLLWLLLLAATTLVGLAEGWRADLFMATPAPGPGELDTPRLIAVNAEKNRCYVLDSELARIIALTPEGMQAGAWPLEGLKLSDTPHPADPMLPTRLLAVGGGTAYLLSLDRATRTLDVVPFDGVGTRRTLTLPDTATYGAVTLDTEARVCVATLRVEKDAAMLNLLREQADGAFASVGTLAHPCDEQIKQLSLTGFAIMPDGRFAIGIAQSGAPQFGFIRSWLAQGVLRGGVLAGEMTVTHRFSLLDARGKLLDRFRAHVELAGQQGYPAKACVPLFTSLAFGPRGMVLSGGHTTDPFLRVYDPDGRVLRSWPREVGGGQSLATLSGNKSLRLYAISPGAGLVKEFSVDGRVVGSLGKPRPYDLALPVALAADAESVYAVVRRGDLYRLLRFTADGRFLWAQRIMPPPELTEAVPLLAIPSGDGVLVGWRMPGVAGLGWIDTVTADGLPGMPFWREAVRGVAATAPCPTPLLRGENGRIYAVRETVAGPRLQAFSATGAFLQQFDMAGVTAVAADSSMAWARSDETGMVLALFNAQGVKRGWTRVPRQAQDAQLLPARAGALWGWLTSTQSLLRFDDKLNVVDEVAPTTPDGARIERISALAGDGAGCLYFGMPDRILVLRLP